MTALSGPRSRSRIGLNALLDPELVRTIRATAADRRTPVRAVVEDALRAGLPYVPAPDDPVVPRAARAEVRHRGRPRELLFVEVAPELVTAVRAASDRKLHHWWVIDQALRHSLGLLPAQEQEVLPETA